MFEVGNVLLERLNSKYRIIFLGVILILVLAQFLIDPISSIRHSLETKKRNREFTAAQDQWNSTGSNKYHFEIYGASQSICAVKALIAVQDNAVTKVQPLSTSSLLPPEKWADPDWGNEVFLCDYNHFTVPQMFAMLEKTLKNSPFAILEVEFDPQYGFLSRFEDGISASHGWLTLRARNIYNEFQILNFEIE